MINSFSLENFRVFKDKTTFKLKPITILTGPNNSGKSSVNKALLLMKENLMDLNKFKYIEELPFLISFMKGEHHLGKYSNVVNHKNDNKEMKFSFETNMDEISQPFIIEITTDVYNESNGCIKEIVIFNKNVKLLSLKPGNTEEGSLIKEFPWTHNRTKINLVGWNNIIKQITKTIDFKHHENLKNKEQLILEKQNEFKNNIKSKKNNSKESDKILERLALDKLTGKSSFKLFEIASKLQDLKFQLFTNEELKAVINNKSYNTKIIRDFIALNNNYKRFGGKNNEVTNSNIEHDLVKNLYDEIKTLQYYTLEANLDEQLLDISNWIEIDNKNVLSSDFDFIHLLTASKEQTGQIQNYILILYLLGKLKFDENTIGITHLLMFMRIVLSNISNIISNGINGITFIPGIKNLNSRGIKQDNSQTWLMNNLSVFYNYTSLEIDKRISDPEYYSGRIEKYLSLFDLEDELIVKNDLEGENFNIYIKSNGVLKHLSDLGMGLAQVISLIVVFSNDYHSIHSINERAFILEEPESNLHPKFQSRLADLFTDFTKTTKSSLLIETHSEYLIRKLQYLIAKGEYNPEDVIIYYIDDPNPEKRQAGAPQIREITIDKFGRMSHDFGKGFFDEADNLAIQLFQLNQQNFN